MRFMMLMIPKGYENAAPGTMPDAKAVEAMMKYNKSLQEAGVLLSLEGLHPPSMGARVAFSGGKPTIIDGPFIQAKEVLGGYWMIQVKSKEEAIDWASRCPASANEIIEIRQVQEYSDFPADVREAGNRHSYREFKRAALSHFSTQGQKSRAISRLVSKRRYHVHSKIRARTFGFSDTSQPEFVFSNRITGGCQ
jgi:hypothetical protein